MIIYVENHKESTIETPTIDKMSLAKISDCNINTHHNPIVFLYASKEQSETTTTKKI